MFKTSVFSILILLNVILLMKNCDFLQKLAFFQSSVPLLKSSSISHVIYIYEIKYICQYIIFVCVNCYSRWKDTFQTHKQKYYVKITLKQVTTKSHIAQIFQDSRRYLPLSARWPLIASYLTDNGDDENSYLK